MIDISKTYRYRNGGPARILCTDSPAGQPVVSMEPNGKINRHNANGSFSISGLAEASYDLIEVKEPREWRLWVNGKGETAVPSHAGSTLTQSNIDAGWVEIRVREILNEPTP